MDKKKNNLTAFGAWSVSRREIISVNDSYYFTKWPSRYGVGGNYKNYNNQLRLFNKNSIVFTNEVHSTGVKCEGKIGFVPSDYFFVHMNCIIRNPTERINKIRSYAKYDNCLAWKYIDEYLPELFPLECLNISNDDLHEFVNLFTELHRHENRHDIQLTESEIKCIFKECTTWILETHHLSLNQIEIYHKSMSNPLLYLPIFILKPYSELLLSLSRYRLFNIVSNHAYKSWKLLELKKNM